MIAEQVGHLSARMRSRSEGDAASRHESRYEGGTRDQWRIRRTDTL